MVARRRHELGLRRMARHLARSLLRPLPSCLPSASTRGRRQHPRPPPGLWGAALAPAPVGCWSAFTAMITPPSLLDLQGITPPSLPYLQGIAPSCLIDLQGITPPSLLDLQGITPPYLLDLQGITPPSLIDLQGMTPCCVWRASPQDDGLAGRTVRPAQRHEPTRRARLHVPRHGRLPLRE